MKLFDDFSDACTDLAEFCVDHESDILLGVGLTCVIGAVVATGIVTTKFIRETDEAKEGIEEIKAAVAEDPDEEDMTEKEEFELTVKSYFKAARWYVIPTLLLGTGLAGIGKSHSELKDEVSGWAASYVALDTVFKTYRKRVVEDQGKEKDVEYRYGARKQEIEEEYEDAKGRKKTRKKEELVIDNADWNEFSKFFDESCNGYRDDPEYNMAYLRSIQGRFNDLIITRQIGRKPGKVYLNEVYDALGIERTEKGQLFGWEYDPNDPAHSSVAPIDFGIMKLKRSNRRFVNGLEPVVLLDFNCERLIGKRNRSVYTP